MKILILGGTRFIGRHIVETLLEAGHKVSILTRGKTRDELPRQVERLEGDRDAGAEGLKALAGRRWDACVDVSGYTPRQVRPSAERLRERVRRYVFISTASVYGDTQERPVREDCPRMEPISEEVTEVNGETYGRLKVTCEDLVQKIYGERCALLRPQIVVGPHDPTGRYPYWVRRAGQGGEMLAPGDGGDHVQVIDVRDLAWFVVSAIERDLGGAFNVAGPRFTWAKFIKMLGAKNVVWVPTEVILAAGIAQFELPIFRPERGQYSALMDLSNDKAQAAGLMLTAAEETIQDVRKAIAGWAEPPLFSREREAELIGRVRAN
ncbi:MAG TPA: NAD-dependent epimerase/dehydratase family protein [Candidatus Acidoferrales bacterium]|nr:NAD-dependent epimerase/dehydratase family protein [Candidatus Acidoferrales bacterium]